MKVMKCLLFISLLFGTNVYGKIYNILDFGASKDSLTESTYGIQKAIDVCHNEGGGVVLVPAGTYLSAMIRVKSNVNLQLDEGATIKALVNGSGYASLINIDAAENVSITGTGTLFGNGSKFIVQESAPGRPRILLVKNSKYVRIEGIRLRSSATWNLSLSGNDHVVIKNISIYSHSNFNNDGIDIDSKNVLITGCNIDCGDDALCLKSDDPKKICENVTIKDCRAASNCNLIKMGTSSVSGFRNINISNCVLRRASESPLHTWSKDPKHYITEPITGISGIALEIVDGGHMDNVNISNIVMTGVQTPIFLRLGARKTPTGSMKNIVISHIKATANSRIGSIISGVPGFDIENVTLQDIELNYPGGGTAEEVAKVMPENEATYPENRMFGWTTPGYGFFVRHAKNITFDNIRLSYQNTELRPAILVDNVDGIKVKNVKAKKPSDGSEWFKQIDSRNVNVE